MSASKRDGNRKKEKRKLKKEMPAERKLLGKKKKKGKPKKRETSVNAGIAWNTPLRIQENRGQEGTYLTRSPFARSNPGHSQQ